MSKQISNYINHIVFVIDASGSMSHLSSSVISVFDNQVKYLAQRSQELDQETRVSVYLFSSDIRCIIYDKDVLRLPSLKTFYHAGGGTALIDGTVQAFEDLAKTPELYGDHAFLVYVITDGEENASSKANITKFPKTVSSLPDNWSVAVFVPSVIGKHEAKKFGFPNDNIQIWDTTTKGIEETGKIISRATDTFMSARSTGVRSSKNLFSLDASSITVKDIKTNLDEVDRNTYDLISVHYDSPIKEYVEKHAGRTYNIGSGFYQLTKPEKIQGYKKICILNNKDGKIYAGDQARKLLGLPDVEIKVNPVSYGNYTIFVESNSVNRKLVGKTRLLLFK